MATKLKTKKTDMIVKLQQVATATDKYYANQTLLIRGKPTKTADFVSLVNGQVKAMQDADALHDAWLKAVADNHAKYVDEVAPAVGAIKSLVDAQFGPASTEFTAFGFTARKKPVLSAKAKAAAVDQSLATRAARHTMGPKQKLAIHGVVAPKAEGGHASAEPAQPAAVPSVTTPNGTSR